MNYITKNSITAPKAEKGGVKSSGNTVSVDSSEEHRGIKCCVPYGFASVVPVGESAVVLPLANGEVSLGVLAKMKNTYASVKSVGRQIMIDLTVDDITRKVQINGNL